MAQWMRSGNIDSTGKESPCIGCIRSLIEHTIKFFPQGTSEQIAIPITHVLAVVDWNENHPQRNYFDETIIVSSSVSHKFTNACFIPVSRIIPRCAYLETSYTFEFGKDHVFICIPLLKKL